MNDILKFLPRIVICSLFLTFIAKDIIFPPLVFGYKFTYTPRDTGYFDVDNRKLYKNTNILARLESNDKKRGYLLFNFQSAYIFYESLISGAVGGNVSNVKITFNVEYNNLTNSNCNLLIDIISSPVTTDGELSLYLGGMSSNDVLLTSITGRLNNGENSIFLNENAFEKIIVNNSTNNGALIRFYYEDNRDSCGFLQVSKDNIIFSFDVDPIVYPLPAINHLLVNNDIASPISEVVSAGQVWLDRNLGAFRVARRFDDEVAYGDLYQWGRGTDGHEKRDSKTSTVTSDNDDPNLDSYPDNDGKFITTDSPPYDWRIPQEDNLWQGESSISNPCPSGFRLPTATELETERASWDSNDAAGAWESPMKLVTAGSRRYDDGTIYSAGIRGRYWSNTVDGLNNSQYLVFYNDGAYINARYRGFGFSVRCIKD